MTTDDPAEPENGGTVYNVAGLWVCPWCAMGYGSAQAAQYCSQTGCGDDVL